MAENRQNRFEEFLVCCKIPILPTDQRDVLPPRTSFVSILPSHSFGDLVNVIQVVSGPGRQRLLQSDPTKSRMSSSARDIRSGEVFCFKFGQFLLTRGGEFVEQPSDRFPWLSLDKATRSQEANVSVVSFFKIVSTRAIQSVRWPGNRCPASSNELRVSSP